jgi:hypothetical protein
MNRSATLLEEIIQSWGWTGIKPIQVVSENSFGNLIVEDEIGQYWRLCPEDCYCEVIADSREKFDLLSVDQSFLEDWCMRPLVAKAEEICGPLNESRKYHFRIPGILGGEYGGSNLVTIDQIEQIRFSGDTARQIQNLPDGVQIELKVVE